MLMSPGYTKLAQKDIVDLNHASECIASVAATIQQMRPQWAPGVMQLLIDANTIVVRIQNKGANAIARYLEKRGVGRSLEKTEVSAADTETGPESSIEPQPE